MKWNYSIININIINKIIINNLCSLPLLLGSCVVVFGSCSRTGRTTGSSESESFSRWDHRERKSFRNPYDGTTTSTPNGTVFQIFRMMDPNSSWVSTDFCVSFTIFRLGFFGLDDLCTIPAQTLDVGTTWSAEIWWAKFVLSSACSVFMGLRVPDVIMIILVTFLMSSKAKAGFRQIMLRW